MRMSFLSQMFSCENLARRPIMVVFPQEDFRKTPIKTIEFCEMVLTRSTYGTHFR